VVATSVVVVVMLAVLAPAAASATVDLSGDRLPKNVEQRRISVGGLETRLLSAAPRGERRSREAAVFLHGFPGSSLDYLRLLSTTGRFGRAVAFDFPGFGRAAKPATQPYTVDSQARFIRRALRRLGIRRVHLVGHDFGGFNGLEWATDHPRRLRSATLIDSGVLPPDYPGHTFAYVNALPGTGEAYNAIQNYAIFRTGLTPPFHPAGLPEPFLRRMYDEYDNPGTRRATPRLYRSFSDFRERSERWVRALRPLDLPARVVWGEDDPYVPSRIAGYQREAFPRARVDVLPGIGHFPFVEAPHRTRKAVRPFLRRMLTR
jgi:pimeloyl-ACP methyl ester carboxylesterase